MSSMEILKYDLKFFDDIKEKSSFVITDNTIKLIEELSNKLTILNKGNNYFEKKSSNKNGFNDNNWNDVKHFKTTTFVKKEGLEKNINTIRINLNKITNKNYETLSVKILDEINNIDKNNVDKNNVDKNNVDKNNVDKNNMEHFITIKKLFIDTVCNINIYSEIYVMLYKNIIEKYDKNFFNIDEDFNKLKKDIIDIKVIDSVINYDEFCNNNKINEKKQNLCLFYINLMKENLFSKEEIIKLILYVQEYNLNKINTINNNVIIDQLCELIYILITNSLECINEDNKYPVIYKNVIFITELKKNENNSVTSKSRFKHMDIIDFINKNNC